MRWWSRCLWLFAWVLPMPAIADTGEVVVRADFVPREAWVGQRVVLQVDVLAAEAWAQLEGRPRIELPGAYVLPPQGDGIRLRETIDGRSYSGQRYEFFVYPQRAGRLTLQVPGVEVRVRQLGAGATEQTISTALPESTFESRVPPGADNITGLISTTGLSVEQRWEPPDGVKQVGDAVRRIVRFEATDVSGMAFAPLDQEPVDGFGLYPAEPQVDDRYNRGQLHGTRTETVTYVAERAGQFELPAIGFTWWDTDKEQLQRVELPGLAVTVGGGTAAKASNGPGAPSHRLSWWWALLMATLVLLFLLRRPAGRAWRAVVRACVASEKYQFRLVQAAIRQGRPVPVMRELMRWLDWINDNQRPARLDRFLDRYGDADTRAALEALQKNLDIAQSVGDRRELSNALVQVRKRWREQTGQRKPGRVMLAPLNGASTREI